MNIDIQDSQKKPLEISFALLKEMNQICNKNKATFIIAFLDKNETSNELKSLVKSENIASLDIHFDFNNHSFTNYPYDNHPNLLGHTLIANKIDVAKRLVSVLEEKQVQYDIKDIAAIINASYPDIRRAINTAQSCVIENRLTLDKASAIQANYMTEVLEMLKDAKDKKVAFTKIRQCIADSKVRDFTPMYTFLYDNLDEFAHGHIAPCILIIAESQFKDASVVDKEINIMAMFVNILGEI